MTKSSVKTLRTEGERSGVCREEVTDVDIQNRTTTYLPDLDLVPIGVYETKVFVVSPSTTVNIHK